MAKKLVILCVAIGLLLALSSCWLMDQKVARTVKKSMQQSMDSDPQYAGKGLKVLEVKVNKLDKIITMALPLWSTRAKHIL